MPNKYVLSFVLALFYALNSCGTQNLFESSTGNTKEEEARLALENEEWDKAITLYTEIITKDPSQYQFYPRLGTSYAGRAGINILEIAVAQLKTDSSGETKLLDSIGQYVPSNPTKVQLSDIGTAVDKIESMPASHRKKDFAYDYSNEANFTLNLYLSSESSMILNQYNVQPTDASGTTEAPTKETLEGMPEAEVDAIFANLDSITNSGDQELGGAAKETLDAILATEGGSNKEKLLNYMTQNGS